MVKSAFEKAMEKMAEIGDLTPEEKEAMRDREQLKPVLAAYYRGDLSKDDLWQRLKGFKPSLLRDAQVQMLDSMRLTSSSDELRLRREGIVAVETLKERPNISAVESALKTLEEIQKRHHDESEAAVRELREAIEKNPQMRVRPVKLPDGRTVLQAAPSVDEAVQARLSEFLAELDDRYEDFFSRTLDKLRGDLS
jgi:chromosome segregation ATPase